MFKQLLSELVGVKKYYGKKCIADILENELGWRDIGSGKFANVYEVPGKNYVVKVWTDDEPYEIFLKYILTHPNKHFPKVLGRLKSIPAMYKRTDRKETVKMVKLERLEPCPAKTYEMVESILRGSRSYKHTYYVDKDYQKKDGSIITVKRERFEYHDLSEIFPQTDSIFDVYHTMMEDLDDTRCSPDVTNRNIMQRSDGTIVLIDPLWYDGTYSLYNLYRMEEESYGGDRYFNDRPPKYYIKPHYLEKEDPLSTNTGRYTPPDEDDEEMPF